MELLVDVWFPKSIASTGVMGSIGGVSFTCYQTVGGVLLSEDVSLS